MVCRSPKPLSRGIAAPPRAKRRCRRLSSEHPARQKGGQDGYDAFFRRFAERARRLTSRLPEYDRLFPRQYVSPLFRSFKPKGVFHPLLCGEGENFVSALFRFFFPVSKHRKQYEHGYHRSAHYIDGVDDLLIRCHGGNVATAGHTAVHSVGVYDRV